MRRGIVVQPKIEAPAPNQIESDIVDDGDSITSTDNPGGGITSELDSKPISTKSSNDSRDDPFDDWPEV